jgi:hypothetical protein
MINLPAECRSQSTQCAYHKATKSCPVSWCAHRAPMLDLLSCPCCGDSAIWAERSERRHLYATTTHVHEWRVQCRGCGISTPWSGSREFIAQAWNRREPRPKSP